MATPSKSSHSPRSARRKSARKRADANRTRRSAPPKPAAPAKPAGPENGAEVKPSLVARSEMEAKREEPVRTIERIPLARPFYDCPRCANRHDALEVKRLTRPADGFSHFAMCPNLGEPILVAMGGA